MVAPYVVDSSALAKSFLAEDHSPELRNWLRQKLTASEPLLAPTLCVYELGEIVRLKGKGTDEDRVRAVERAAGLVQLVSPHSTLPTTFDGTKGLSFYDATFLALARLVGATLVTYDRRLATMAAAAGIRVKAPGVE